MNENSYDVVLVDGDPAQVAQNVEHALRLVRVGGTVLVPHILQDGDVANPAKRAGVVSGFRSVLTEATDSENIVVALSPAGDGLLQFTKIS
jgi:predicted O-methyltransferase YrrM